MLRTGRSVVEHIFACYEGVMGSHNDRRTSKNMPANGRAKVLFYQLFNWSVPWGGCDKTKNPKY